MSTNTTRIFRATYPIDFDLFDKDSQNVLYIEDNSDQLLTLNIRNASNQDIVLKDLSAAPLSATNYHFALRFRPGTLATTSVTGTKTIQLTSHTAKSNWEMLQAPHNNDDWDVIYLRKTKELLLECTTEKNTPTGQTIVFNHVGADGTPGARGTRVELVCTNMNYKGSVEPINTRREMHLGIINHRGKKNIPWQLGFVGGHTIVNDGKPNTPLTLRIANITPYNALNPTQSILTFKYDAKDATQTTKIILSFQTGVDDDDDWALDTKDKVSAIKIDAIPGWTTKEPEEGKEPIWILTPNQTIYLPCKEDPVNGTKSHIDIKINNVVSNFPCGQTNLYIYYQNIPGYWDGNEACIIEKTPVKVEKDLVEMNGSSSGENIPFQIVSSSTGVGPLMGFMLKNDSKEKTKCMVIGSFGSANNIENFNRPLLITNKGADEKETPIARFTVDGKVGIGNITQPAAIIDVAPQAAIPALQLQNGNHVTGTEQNQLALGYNEPRTDHPQRNVFRHVIKTRHTSGAAKGNSIDFYVWNFGKDKDTDLGTMHTLSINGGKVGIGGKTDPDATLDVTGDIKCGLPGSDPYGMGLTVTNARIWCNSTGGGMWAGTERNGFFGMDEFSSVGIWHKSKDGEGWVIRAKKVGSSADVTIHGRLFIETVNQIEEKETRYMVHKPSNHEVGWYDASDQRLKKNIAPLPYALETIKQLRGVSFNWNEEGLQQKTKDVEENCRSVSNTPEENATVWAQQKQHIRQENARTFHGFIAQEVEAVFPDWVKENKDGYKTINMDELAPVMVEAIKAQQEQINALQAQMEMLMNELKALKAGR